MPAFPRRSQAVVLVAAFIIVAMVIATLVPRGAHAQHLSGERVSVEAVFAPSAESPLVSALAPEGWLPVSTPPATAPLSPDDWPRTQPGCGGPWRPTLGLLGAATGMAVIGKWAADQSGSIPSRLLSVIWGPAAGVVVGGALGLTAGEQIDCRHARRRGPTLPHGPDP